jgi:GAF domain-containing protein/PAS domain-containing protein
MAQVKALSRTDALRGVAVFDGGEMAKLIAEADWSASPAGAPEDWPQSLKTTVGLILPAAAQIVLFWGPQFVAIYNDAYAPTIGEKHPRALGRPACENWAELWDDLEPLLQSVRDTGETVYAKDRPFYIERHGYPETVYFDISYSAVPDEAGEVGGVLCVVSETTERVLSEQRNVADRERLTRMFEQAPTFLALMNGPEHVFEVANPAYRQLVGNRDVVGKSVREALPEIAGQGFFDLLDEVYESNEPYVGLDTRVMVERDGGKQERFVDFVYQPMVDQAGRVTGILVQGSDVTERHIAESLRDTQRRVLELAIQDTTLEEALSTLIDTVEKHSTAGVLASVLLMDQDGRHLRHASAPSLPSAYNEAIDGVEIGPSVGSCGTAAFRKEPVYVTDIGSDPLWADFRELALSHDLRACWSTPILSGSDRVLGTFAMYYKEPRQPTSKDLELVDFVTRSAALVIERKQAEQALRDEGHNLEILNRTGAAIAGELDLERVVQMVTDAGVELTGAQFGAFFYNVVDPAGESYMLYTLSGVPRSAFEKFPMPRNTKVFAPTFTGEGVVRSDDITRDPRYGQNAPYYGMPEGHLPVVSYLAVPVTGRQGEVIGGLFFGHEEIGRFSERHERLMEGIAAQAAIAIDNARLFGAAQHEIDQRQKAEQALTALNETLESRVSEEIGRRSHAEEALRQTQKMETVGQLSGGIAHDFNNLLQVIHGNLSILERSLPPGSDPKLQRSVTNALSGTERAAALTKRLLAFSRRQALDPRPVDVNRLILDMTELLHRTLGETVVIDTRLSGEVPNALVDANQLENAILNLAINARDAMPGGGRLELCTSSAELDEGISAANPEAVPGRYVAIEVRDTGHGMSEDVRSRAVEPFFSTKEVGQGTGLGLSMVYGFVRQSGGHLVLNSSEGSGTTIVLYLPCSNAAAQARERGDTSNELPIGRGERVLLCEDDDEVRFFSRETLTELGYEVIEARDATSAIDALIEHGRIDLLFTDVVLPGGKTGADLARDARKLQPGLRVLFTTGYARSALDREQRGEKGVEVLLKPFRVDELAEKIRDMLD